MHEPTPVYQFPYSYFFLSFGLAALQSVHLLDRNKVKMLNCRGGNKISFSFFVHFSYALFTTYRYNLIASIITGAENFN